MKSPLAGLAVGESLFRPGLAGLRLIASSRSYAARHYGWRYRAELENDGVRITREPDATKRRGGESTETLAGKLRALPQGQSIFASGVAGDRLVTAAKALARSDKDFHYASRSEGDGKRVWRWYPKASGLKLPKLAQRRPESDDRVDYDFGSMAVGDCRVFTGPVAMRAYNAAKSYHWYHKPDNYYVARRKGDVVKVHRMK